jgi:hypothetical protein
MRSLALACLISLAACGSDAKSGGKSSSNEDDDDKPAKTSSGSAKPSGSAPVKRGPSPRKEPEKLTSPIRENVVTGDFKDGAAFEARVFVSKLTTADALHIAMHFKLEKPLDKDDPLRAATFDAADVLRGLKFEVTSPSGKTTLQTSEKLGEGGTSLAFYDAEIKIDGRGAAQHGKLAPWQKPAPDLFAKAGKYTIEISGQLKAADRTVAIALKPIEFEIVDVSPTFKSLAELANDATQIVRAKKGLAKAPASFTAVIDDTDGNRWYRHQLDTEGETAHGHYDVEIIEVLVDPAGKEVNYDSFLHFTCVAEGVTIATPTGRVPVEKLNIGDSVVSYDVATKTKRISLVEHVSASHAERLFRFGDLLVTGAHPIYVGNRFELAANLAPGSEMLRIDLGTERFDPIEVELPTTVYELSVSEPHTYFAGGLLVHNKAVYEPVGGQKQPWQGWFYRRAVKR